MNTLAAVLSVALIALPYLAVVIVAVLYLAVAQDESARERTATREMWERSLDYYRNDTGHGVTAVTRKRSSRSGLRPVRHEKVTRAAGK